MRRALAAVAAALLVAGAAVVAATSSDHPDAAAVSSACQIASPVFCETFDAPHNAGTRTGDLDPVLWGVSRLGQANDGNGQHNRVFWPTITQCGANGPTAPPGDVRICNGVLHEGVNDGHGVANLNMYPKQPFDFTGRTGIATFDVSADSEGSHSAWPEFVITDKPVPGVRSDISNTAGTSGNNDVPPPAALNEVGFAIDNGCLNQLNTTGIGVVYVSRNGTFQEQPFTSTGCVTKGSPASLNHFEVRVSQNHLEVWGTDSGSSVLKQLAVVNNINLSFTKGLVWIDDVHYNADKFPNPNGQRDHQFAWDNVGFDGPPTYRDLGFDVADNTVHAVAGATDLGYQVGPSQITLSTQTVRSVQAPTGAQVVVNYLASTPIPPDVSVNGGPFIATASPFHDPGGYLWKSISIPVPLTQVNDARTGGTGANTITFRSGDGLMQIGNISLILVAAAPVPGGTPPPPTTTTTAPSTTTSTIPPSTSTSTTTIPATTTTVAPLCTITGQVVQCPADYTGSIFVGSQQIWPQSTTTTTTAPTTTTTVAPSTTTSTTTAPTTTMPTTQHFGMLSVGATLPSDATCASQVRPASEQRADNVTANHTLSNGTNLTGRYTRVTGNFQGTTDELIQWAACKWGIDEDYVRAQAILESYWHQNALGDFGTTAANCAPGHPIGADGQPGKCPESIGILQVRYPYWQPGFPGSGVSTAFNLDYALAARRGCFEGDDTWLNGFERGHDYAAGDIAGCMGLWFAGRWYTDPANQYIAAWQDALAAHVWTTAGFVNG